MKKYCKELKYIESYWRHSVLSLVILLGTLSASATLESIRVTLSFKDSGLPAILKEIKKQSKYDFMYNAKDIDSDKKISIELEDASLDMALNACLTPYALTYTLENKLIVLKKEGQQPESPKTSYVVNGTVRDKQGNALPGVTIILQGTTLGTVTDELGNFKFNVPFGEHVLNFSFMGMKSVSRVVSGKQTLNITMDDVATAMDEVVVTGMEVVKKDHMTGSASVITAKDLRSQGISSIDRILEGTVAGLNSTSLSGAPGTRARITIRGENNLSGHTEPLWIVDGLPLMSGVPENNTGDYAGTIMQDGVGNIMPEDIESVTILKDASAAAIYGARAANGVIVITTKKGFRSKTQFNYTGNYSIADAPKMNMDFMNAREKLSYETDVVKTFGLDYYYWAGRGGLLYNRMMEGYLTQETYNQAYNELASRNTDWFDVVFRKAQSHSHNISLRGGSEEMTYYTSLNFQEKSGILRSNKYSNAGILMKLDYRPIKNLILALDLSANVRKNRDHASTVDPFQYAVFANPYERPYDENGEYAADLSYLSNNYTPETASGYVFDSFNILRELEDTKRAEDGLDASFTFNIRYDIIPGLAVSSIIRKGVSYNTTETSVEAGTYTSYIQEDFAKEVYDNPTVLPNKYNNGELSEASGKNFNWSIRNQIDYSFDIKDDHLFSILLANEITSKKFQNFGYRSPIYYGDYRITGIPDFGNDASYNDLRDEIGGMFNTSTGQDRTVSFLGTLRYGYKDRYIANFNFRMDGADVIGKSNRYTPLYSIGLRYNLHNENFFKNDVVTELALRGSFGYTGNIDRTAYPFSTISLGSDTYEGNRVINGFTYPNPTVGWEKKLDRNLGIDLGLFNGRGNFTMDYYNNRTKDILENLTIPVSSGREHVRANGGILENSGIELYLNVRWISRPDLTFSTSANMARNKNVIVRSEHDYKSYKEAFQTSYLKGGVINVVGEETGSIYGWKVAGVDPETGMPKFYLTEEGQREYMNKMEELEAPAGDMPESIVFNKDDDFFYPWYKASMQYLGRSNPKYVGGFNTYLRYKNFEFTTQWSFKAGHIIPSFNDLQNAPNNWGDASQRSIGYANDLSVSGTNRARRYLNFWKMPGDMTDVSRFVTGQDFWAGYTTSDKYEKGNYLRLSNVAVSYRLPSDLVQRMGLTNMSLSFNAYNLLTFTKYKGLDVGTMGAFSYPVSREYNIKLSVGF